MPRLPSYAVVWLLLVFAWTGNFIIRIGFSALLPPIIQELQISYTAAGVLAAAFFYAYGAMQLPAGLLGDRFGRRRVLVTGLVVGAVASILTGLAGTYAAVLIARLLTGLGQGCVFSNDRSLIASVTPPAKIALGQGVSFTGPGLGLMLGLLLGGVLGEVLPWRFAFFIFAVGPLLAALLIARLVPAARRTTTLPPLASRLRAIFGKRDLWILSLVGVTGIYVQFVLATWAPVLFIEVGVKGLGRAGTYASLQGAAAVVGLIIGGWVGDRARRRGLSHKVVITACLLCLAISMVMMGMVVSAGHSPGALAITLAAAAFFVWAMWGPCYAMLGEIVAVEDLGTGFGFFNSVSFVGAMIGPTLTGWLRDQLGSFAPACYVSAAISLLGLALALMLRSAARLPPPVRS